MHPITNAGMARGRARNATSSTSGQTTYHCSSMDSDHMCSSGEGVENCAKYESPASTGRQFAMYTTVATPSRRSPQSSSGSAMNAA